MMTRGGEGDVILLVLVFALKRFSLSLFRNEMKTFANNSQGGKWYSAARGSEHTFQKASHTQIVVLSD
jgi:hypothetical protein